jgi:hypothetical protein
VGVVVTPIQWRWRTARIGTQDGQVVDEERADLARVASALRYWWLRSFHDGATGAPGNFAPAWWIRRRVRAVAVETLPMGSTRADWLGKASLATPSVCYALSAVRAPYCSGITVLWVRWTSKRAASHIPLQFLAF